MMKRCLLLAVVLICALPPHVLFEQAQAEDPNVRGVLTVPSDWVDMFDGTPVRFTAEGTIRYVDGGAEVSRPCQIGEDNILIFHETGEAEELPYSLWGGVLNLFWKSGHGSAMTQVLPEKLVSSATPEPESTPTEPDPTPAAAPLGEFPYLFTEERYTAYPVDRIPTTRGYDIQMIEDERGILHAVYIDEGENLTHKAFENGAWSKPRILLPKTDEGFLWAYNLILTPSGEPAVAHVSITISSDVYYIRRLVGNASDEAVLMLQHGTSAGTFLQAYYDTSGSLHILHDRNAADDSKTGLYLDDRQLTRRGLDDYGHLVQDGFVKGLGEKMGWTQFLYDSKGVLYCYGLMEDGLMRDDQSARWLITYSAVYSHSYDNGATWQGPYVAYSGLLNAQYLDAAAHPNGPMTIMLYDGIAWGWETNDPNLILISGDTLGRSAVKSFYDRKEIERKLYDEKDERYGYPHFIEPAFSNVKIGADQMLHFRAEHDQKAVHAVLLPDGTLQIIETDAPISMNNMILRRDGTAVFYGAEYSTGDNGKTGDRRYMLYLPGN